MTLTFRLAAPAALAIAGLVPAVGTATASAAPAWGAGRAGTAVAGRVPVTGPRAPGSLAAGGSQLWAALYKGLHGSSQASGLAVSPNGAQVFATGTSAGANGSTDFVTIAYNAATGAKQWIRRYDGAGSGPMQAKAIAVSPDGTKVFVTGQFAGTLRAGLQTVAYDAATGAQLWTARLDDGAVHHGSAKALAVSPDGAKVWVTGTFQFGSAHAVTLAYNPATGKPAGTTGLSALEIPAAIAVSPDSARVFVTGSGRGAATVAYDAATGARLWSQRLCGFGTCPGVAVKVSPDGSTVYVAGVAGFGGTPAWVTEAYNSATGKRLWRERYENGPGSSTPASLAVSPGGSMVFVTGTTGESAGGEYSTVAYTATGQRVWVSHYAGPSKHSAAASVAVSPDGSRVFVTGESQGRPVSGVAYFRFTTIAYAGATGATLWRANYGVRKENSSAVAVAVSPDGSTVFVTGTGERRNGTYLATVAYGS